MSWLLFFYYLTMSFFAINIGLRTLDYSSMEHIIFDNPDMSWFVVRHLVALGFALACATAMGFNQKDPRTVYFSLGVSGGMAITMYMYATYPMEFPFHICFGIILFGASIILEFCTKTFSFTDFVTDLLFSIALTWLFVSIIEKLEINLISIESWVMTGFLGLFQIWLAANCRGAELPAYDDDDEDDD